MQIDLNCDLGEGAGNDLELLPLVTSINIACCRHAGSPGQVLELLKHASRHNVIIGAHPGFNDPENFGRLEHSLSDEQLLAECLYQVGALSTLASFANVKLSHLKPHGALYHQASKTKSLAKIIISIAQRFNLAVIAPPNSELQTCATGNVPFYPEGFADRQYLANGNLVPRNLPDAFIHDPAIAAAQAKTLIEKSRIETLCIHGDQPNAFDFAKKLRLELEKNGISIRGFK